jgi:3-dehydroquinate dehydratase
MTGSMPEALTSAAARWLHTPPDVADERVDVVAARDEQTALTRAAAESPVLFTIRSADELTLMCG